MLRVLNRVPKQWKQRAETNYKGLEAILLIDSINHRSPVKDQPSNMATVNLLLLQKNIYKYVKKKSLPHKTEKNTIGSSEHLVVPASQCCDDVSHTSAGGLSASTVPENDSGPYAPFGLHQRRLCFQRQKLPDKEAPVRPDPSHRLAE